MRRRITSCPHKALRPRDGCGPIPREGSRPRDPWFPEAHALFDRATKRHLEAWHVSRRAGTRALPELHPAGAGWGIPEGSPGGTIVRTFRNSFELKFGQNCCNLFDLSRLSIAMGLGPGIVMPTGE
jgi:hypothetical protein